MKARSTAAWALTALAVSALIACNNDRVTSPAKAPIRLRLPACMTPDLEQIEILQVLRYEDGRYPAGFNKLHPCGKQRHHDPGVQGEDGNLPRDAVPRRFSGRCYSD
ncbi:MAG: hypothetical protein U0163_01885 [Gemmatimonadaceae bacterium]